MDSSVTKTFTMGWGGNAPARTRARAMRRRERTRAGRGGDWASILMIVAGATLCAVSFNLILRPSGIPSGGVIGLSLLFERLLGWSPAYSQWALNLGLLALCGAALGRGFVLKSLIGSLLVPLVVLLTSRLAPLTTTPLLATLCGGAGMGAGIGLVYRANGSVGGLTGVALWLHRVRGWPVDRIMIAFDGVVLALTAAWLGAEAALHAALGVFVIGRSAKAVMTGFNNAKVATIISHRSAEIRRAVLNDVSLGVTTLVGRGGFSGCEQEVLMVVMTPSELTGLKAAVRAEDPHAFVIVSDAAEVVGHGFASHG